MKKGKAAFLLILFAFSFFALGYFRNYIFLAVNDRAAALYYHGESHPLNGILSIFKSFSYANLITIKWVLTFLFSLLFTILSGVTIYSVFQSKHYVYVSVAFNSLVFIFSLLFIAIGEIIHPFLNQAFVISRSISHFEQSPILTIILLSAIFFDKKRQG
jgi:hypothetical protein